MEVKDLELKVKSAETKVEKCKSTIERHQKQLDKKLEVLSKKGVNTSNLEAMKRNADGTGSEYYWDVCEIERKYDDIKGATKKLREAENVLENWKQKLSVEVEKERFIEGNAPQVIKDFLEDWKTKVIEWHIRKYNSYQTYKKELADQEYQARIEAVKTLPEYSEYLDENGEVKDYFKREFELHNIRPRKPMETFLKERGLDYRSIEGKKANFAGASVLYMCTISKENERLAWLEKTIEADKKAKMIDLINRINKVVGTILDASYLRISEVGNLNGYIIGEKGKAKVETIGCGGWNVQVFHYRTIVNKMK